MALVRRQSEFVFTSGTSTQYYTFTIAVDGNNLITVTDIETPSGTLCDAGSSLPQSVLDDIQTAISQVRDLVGQTSAINGTLTFSNETYQDVTFATAMIGTTYRVVFSVVDFIAVRVTNKTTAGFRVETSATYSGDIGFDVFI